jgi:hypothetical protein
MNLMTGSSNAENRSNMSGEKQWLRMTLLKPRRSESDRNEPLPQSVESQGSLFGGEFHNFSFIYIFWFWFI